VRNRLERLRPGAGRANGQQSDRELAKWLGGEVTADGLIEVERRLDLGHGWSERFALDLRHGLPDSLDPAPADWVFMDTETTGLAGGSGTLAFLIGLARLQGDVLVARQFLATRFAGEAMLLRRAGAWLGEAALISYNGKTFDAPLLSTRCRLARVQDWLDGRPHLDLLYPVRRAFAGRWADCRLATAERQLAGVQRHDDLPGAEAPAAWLAHLRSGDARRLPGVLQHNHQDLVSLARLLPPLVGTYAAPQRHDACAEAVARAWARRGATARARAVLTANLHRLGSGGLHELARLHRRAGDWASAGALWRQLAAADDHQAVAALAKYEEHVRGDVAAAVAWAVRLPEDAARSRRLRRLAQKQAPRLQPLPLD
jgi:uncharacterized protein YprB with RNaseH-like and TPR domain